MNNVQYTSTILKRLLWRILQKSRSTVQIESTQIRWFLGQSDGRLDLMIGSQRHSKISWFKGGHQA